MSSVLDGVFGPSGTSMPRFFGARFEPRIDRRTDACDVRGGGGGSDVRWW